MVLEAREGSCRCLPSICQIEGARALFRVTLVRFYCIPVSCVVPEAGKGGSDKLHESRCGSSGGGNEVCGSALIVPQQPSAHLYYQRNRRTVDAEGKGLSS